MMATVSGGISCGRCHQKHPSVADVRRCYNGESVDSVAFELSASDRPGEKRIRFLKSLLSQLGAEPVGWAPEDIYWRDASRKIDELLATVKGGPVPSYVRVVGPRQPRDRSGHGQFSDVPDGYYATRSLTGHNDLDFWRVSRRDRRGGGQWVNVQRVIGGHADVRVGGTVRRQALDAIAAAGCDVAGNLFADELGQCRNCGRHLTDELSRSRRYGPDCWAAR